MKLTATLIAAFLAVQINASPLSGGEDPTGAVRTVDRVSGVEWQASQQVKGAAFTVVDAAGTAASVVTLGAVGGGSDRQLVKGAAETAIVNTVSGDIVAHQTGVRAANAVLTGGRAGGVGGGAGGGIGSLVGSGGSGILGGLNGGASSLGLGTGELGAGEVVPGGIGNLGGRPRVIDGYGRDGMPGLQSTLHDQTAHLRDPGYDLGRGAEGFKDQAGGLVHGAGTLLKGGHIGSNSELGSSINSHIASGDLGSGTTGGLGGVGGNLPIGGGGLNPGFGGNLGAGSIGPIGGSGLNPGTDGNIGGGSLESIGNIGGGDISSDITAGTLIRYFPSLD